MRGAGGRRVLGTRGQGEKPRLWGQTDLWSRSRSSPVAASFHSISDKGAGQHLVDALEIPYAP